MEDILAPLVNGWLGKIELAMQYKNDHFQEAANEAMRFYNGPHDWMYQKEWAGRGRGFRYSGEDDFPNPTFRMSLNRVAEMVALFGPVLYHRNPIRQINPRKMLIPPVEIFGNPNDPTPAGPPTLDPMTGMPMQPTVGQMVVQQYSQIVQQIQQGRGIDKARAMLFEAYQNYTPNELDLKSESRLAIDEAIIKGMGVLWPEVKDANAGIKIVGSFYDTVDNLLIDPDMESLKDAFWTARLCTHPVWFVEREYGLEPGSLKAGNMESYSSQGETTADPTGDYKRKTGQTNDLIRYWKIYSKMGMGGRMTGMKNEALKALEQFGDYCFLVVADGFNFPLNIPKDLNISPEDFAKRVAWPVPYWKDNEWPFTPIIFHPVPRCAWPMSHLTPAMGEIKFLDWAYSFLAGKIRTTCRDFIAILKSAGEELKATILHGGDMELLEIEAAHGKLISEIVQFLQHPQMNGDIWTVIQAIETNLEKRLGLNELMYGMSSRQMRSASEAQLKSDQISVRPDDMAQSVEDAMTKVARKEGLAARWLLTPQDVAPILGDFAAGLWQSLVMSSSPQTALELEYRIEASSARKPNKDRDAANMGQAMQSIAQFLYQYTMTTGDVKPFNALIADWAKSIDMDPERYLLQPPPPPPTPGPGSPAGEAANHGTAGGQPPPTGS